VLALGLGFATAAWADPDAAPVTQLEANAAPVLRAVRFEGNDAISDRTLAKLVDTKPRPRLQVWKDRPAFDADVLAADVERVQRYYQAAGYFEARVAAAPTPDPEGGVVARFDVVEGEPVRLADRRIDVPPGFDAAALTADLPLEVGDVFSLERYDAAKSLIQSRLADLGHPLAAVEGGADVYVPEHEAKLTWRVEPGPAVRFGDVRIAGGAGVRPALVDAEIEIEEGAPYAPEALRETRTGVASLGTFRSVVVQPLPSEAEVAADGAQIWPVEVRLDERAPRSVRLGFGWGTDDRLRAQVRWEHRNLFGGAEHLRTQLRYSSIESAARADFDVPHWLAREQSLHLESWLGKEKNVAYTAQRVVGGAGVQRAFGDHWSARAGWQGSWNEVTDTSTRAEQLLDDPKRAVVLSGLRFGVRHTDVDDLVDPKRGWWLELEARPFLRALGSEEAFAAMTAEGRVYHPIGATVLAGRLRVGTIEPLGGTSAAEVPMVERFYLGGGSSVRGFAYQGLGPVQADGEPIGGTTLLEASAEVRFPIRRSLSGVAFVDAGRLDLDPHRFALDGIVFSIGAGLRYVTPLGPVRVDVAFPIDAPPEAEESHFFISIGQSF
jgi:outer membrane protein assembly complex protein YaeT